ncbi:MULTISPECIES: hypothetical protein [unclassified Bradyrhizobium]|uniref:hypothetical protein n=1 Tax=unclassified Bradyrhizobium TaxID=2631580 RepID=UPI0029160B7F|nr:MULTISPECIES: hypothetical protein [unclassified Bradyrhizobium]
MPNVTIALLEPIEGGRGQIKEVVLRPPKYRDIAALGEPSAYARSDDGLMFTSDKDEVVHGYIERLLVEPQDAALLEQLGLADALKLREAVHGFFQAARKAISADKSTT